MLSDIEKGGSNPTINTIWKIANGLNVPYTRLMEEIEKKATVIRKSDSMMQTDETKHYRDSLVFDSSIAHTYINRRNTLLTFMVVNFYPN